MTQAQRVKRMERGETAKRGVELRHTVRGRRKESRRVGCPTQWRLRRRSMRIMVILMRVVRCRRCESSRPILVRIRYFRSILCVCVCCLALHGARVMRLTQLQTDRRRIRPAQGGMRVRMGMRMGMRVRRRRDMRGRMTHNTRDNTRRGAARGVIVDPNRLSEWIDAIGWVAGAIELFSRIHHSRLGVLLCKLIPCVGCRSTRTRTRSEHLIRLTAMQRCTRRRTG